MGANVPGHLFLVCFWVMRIPHVHTDDLVVLRSREANQHTLDFFEAICQFGLVDGLIAVALVSEESGLGHCFFAPLQASAHDVVQHGRQVACSAANHPEKHLGHSLWRRVQLRSEPFLRWSFGRRAQLLCWRWKRRWLRNVRAACCASWGQTTDRLSSWGQTTGRRFWRCSLWFGRMDRGPQETQ